MLAPRIVLAEKLENYVSLLVSEACEALFLLKNDSIFSRIMGLKPYAYIIAKIQWR